MKRKIEKVGMEQVVVYDKRQYHYRLQPGDGTAYTFSLIRLNEEDFQAGCDVYYRSGEIFLFNITMISGGSTIVGKNAAWAKASVDGDFQDQLKAGEYLYSTLLPKMKGVHHYTLYVLCAALMELLLNPTNIGVAVDLLIAARKRRISTEREMEQVHKDFQD